MLFHAHRMIEINNRLKTKIWILRMPRCQTRFCNLEKEGQRANGVRRTIFVQLWWVKISCSLSKAKSQKSQISQFVYLFRGLIKWIKLLEAKKNIYFDDLAMFFLQQFERIFCSVNCTRRATWNMMTILLLPAKKTKKRKLDFVFDSLDIANRNETRKGGGGHIKSKQQLFSNLVPNAMTWQAERWNRQTDEEKETSLQERKLRGKSARKPEKRTLLFFSDIDFEKRKKGDTQNELLY